MVVSTLFQNTVFNINGVMDDVSVTHFSKYLMIFLASLSAAKIPLAMLSVARDFSLRLNSVLGKKVPTSSLLKSFKHSLMTVGTTLRSYNLVT
jgi:hypothetical protein